MSKRDKKAFETAKSVFDDYFSDVCFNNDEIRYVTYKEIQEDKKHKIYCAVIEYKDFRQYVNFYENGAVVNCVFDFDNCPLCHFGDILNVTDSDDLSFYTYKSCYNTDMIRCALDKIMLATDKYFTDITNISKSQKKKEIIRNEINLLCDDECVDNKDIADDVDLLQFIYGTLVLFDKNNGYIDFLKDLKKKKLKGEKLNMYENRAHRVLSRLSKKQLTQMSDNIKKTTQDKLYLYSPYVFFAIVFAIIFGIMGIKIQSALYEGYIGFDLFDSALGFGTAGAAFSLIFTGIFDKLIYKIIVPKSKKDHLNMILEKEKATVWGVVIGVIGSVAICAFFILNFCFSGAGFSEDNIKFRNYCFQKFQTYSYGDVEIAEIKGDYSDGSYSEYLDKAYAFCFDGDNWYEYGVADEETKCLIEKKAKEYNKEINTYKTVGDIK